ncbi:helix-turn-helix domain-containing protein [Xanthomonas axonopodis]|uniref:helix-turn-helix domain-containing protein n=1 Tax=Xanthomonas axonopodis TaxID=53413 RepID=UPI003CCEB96A
MYGKTTLLLMQKRTVQRGRPAGATTYDARLARAFGAAVRALRSEKGLGQELLAHRAGVERSHMGKVERGEHLPTLAIVFKIAQALECSMAVLMAETERQLAAVPDAADESAPPRGGAR